MGQEIKFFKEQAIANYFNVIDTTNIDVNQIRSDLKKILQEEPSIKLNYKKDYMMLEDGTRGKESIESLNSVTITYSYDTIDAEGNAIILPAQDTFLIK